ncbi:hypothetical protein PMAYCL1PPCAC_25492, partial [Pristionchus mayeri]
MSGALLCLRPKVLPESDSWDTIPVPPLERICHFLYNQNNGTDLANLAKVPRHYYHIVMKFIRGPSNRPGIDKVLIMKNRGGLEMEMTIYRSNLPFYSLASLDKKRFRLLSTFICLPMLVVSLSGPQDSIIEKVRNAVN